MHYIRELHWPIRTEEQLPQCWVATMDNYDGPGSVIGAGATRRKAIEDLLDQVIDFEDCGGCEQDKCACMVRCSLDFSAAVERAVQEGK